MNKRLAIIVASAVALVACAAAPTRPMPPAGAPTAELNDSLDEDADGSNGRVFAVWALNDVEVLNAARNVQRVGFGAGAGALPYLLARPIEAKPVKVSVVGKHRVGAPIEELARRAKGTFQSVEGVLDFSPQPNTVYRVAGRLSPAQSEIWIEEAESKRVVTSKVVVKATP
jgi:hypothetical protein